MMKSQTVSPTATSSFKAFFLISFLFLFQFLTRLLLFLFLLAFNTQHWSRCSGAEHWSTGADAPERSSAPEWSTGAPEQMLRSRAVLRSGALEHWSRCSGAEHTKLQLLPKSLPTAFHSRFWP